MLHLGLIERRDRALAALRELEFDHHTGKVSDVDYRELIGPLRLEAADSLRSLDDTGLGAVRAASARRRSGRQRARRKEDRLLVGSSAATPTLSREKHS